MNSHVDLTRWNRAGLRHFLYVDGNAADYLERLRAEMQARFPQWERVVSDVSAADNGDYEAEAERFRRALVYYHAERGDWGWEILRAFVRATHVLGEHVGAYANEGFLETATQWDNIRRLVEMLDYHPAPPSSASTPLVLLAKQARKGLVAEGFQVKYTPPEGGAPVVFESLEDLVVDSGLNELHLQYWNRSPSFFDPFHCKGEAVISPWVVPEKAEVSVGDVALLLQESEPAAVVVLPETRACRIEKLNRDTARLCLKKPVSVSEIPKKIIPGFGTGSSLSSVKPTSILININSINSGITLPAFTLPAFAPWKKGYTRLLISPKDIYVPHLNGPDIVSFVKPHGLVVDEVICWNLSGSWYFDRVIEHDEIGLRLAKSNPMPAGVVYKALEIPGAVYQPSTELEFRVPLDTLTATYLDPNGSLQPLAVSGDFELVSAPTTGEPSYYKLKATFAKVTLRLLIVRPDMPKVGDVSAVDLGTYRFDGSPGDLKSGDWLVGEFGKTSDSSELQVLHIERIDVLEDEFVLAFSSVVTPTTGSEVFVPSLFAIEMTLDEPVFNSMTFTELASGKVGEREVTAIQGVGRRYAQAFNSIEVHSIADLANLDLSKDSKVISLVRRREFKAKAELVLAYSRASVESTSLGTKTLEQLAAAGGIGTTLPGSVLQRMLRLYGPFQQTLRPIGYDVNTDPVSGVELTLDNKNAKIPELLKPGRIVLLEQASKLANGNPKQAVVDKVEDNLITLKQKLTLDDGFTLGNTIIRGNVLTAGHGADKGEKVLGSGDATQRNQFFIFKVPGIAFVSDSTMPSGVRADISLRVDVRTWQQVSSLRDSRPADPHYTVHMTEEGFLNIGFGDGENGRRLPTGVNNIRVAYRVGSGLAGNVPAHGLLKPVKPHKLVAAVQQPILATGGNDMEGTASLRENAPASLLTLERAVSLNDFANLAVSQSSVWQARAFPQSTLLARQVSIRVVIVPAGGVGLDKDLNAVIPQSFLDNQARFLKAHSQPGIAVSAFAYQPILVNARVTIRVKYDEYDAEATKDKVYLALQQALTLKQRKLGEPLYRSELYKIVESVTGVENSECFIELVAGMEGRPLRVNTQGLNNETIIRSIQARETQVIYLDPVYSSPLVEVKEFEL
jgi:hypothetical protein